MPGFDLHIHTNYSDGTENIKDIVFTAMELGLAGIAITDHDTVDGLKEALDLGNKLNYLIIPGIELSSEYLNREIHILGYFIDHNCLVFKNKLLEIQKVRQERVKTIVDKLQNLGMEINLEEVLKCAGQGSIGRPHVAHVLKTKGYVSSYSEAFRDLIGRDGPAYAPRFKLTPYEAIDLIYIGGGIPVLAHPGINQLDKLIIPLWKYGLKGIEVFHPDHSYEDEIRYKELAKDLNLISTGGSDFHGLYRSPLGSRRVTANVLWEFQKLLGISHHD